MSPESVREIKRLARRILRLVEQDDPEPDPVRLSPTQRHILAVLTDTPQSIQRLASRTNHRLNNYFRQQLHRLVDRELVRHVSRGFRRP
jgi:predicted transcriptional regulator